MISGTLKKRLGLVFVPEPVERARPNPPDRCAAAFETLSTLPTHGQIMPPVQSEVSMLPFYLILGSVLSLSVLSGAAAVALAFRHAHLDACQRRTVDRLTQIAFISAASIVALLYAFYPA
jgi:hypothetical protein